MSRKYTVKQVKKAIVNSAGAVSQVAKRLGCEWHTANKYINMYDETKKQMANELESKLDLAEYKLLENIRNNDNTAIIFFLKTKGKNRGYVERQEIRAESKRVVQVFKIGNTEIEL